MKPFNWEIGEVPKGWESANRVQVLNGDFRGGPRAAVVPVFYVSFMAGAFDASLCYYHFYREDAERVRAWVDWFMKERDE